MISCKMKKILTVILTAALSISMMMFVGMTTANAQADYDMSMVAGASVRTSGDVAIRFQTRVKTSEINELIDAQKDVEVVTLITPTRYLQGNKLNAEFTGGMKEVVFSVANKNLVDNDGYVVPTKDGYNLYNACLYKVQEHNIAQDFTAVSYIKVDGEIVEHTETTSGNVWDAAKDYLADNSDLATIEPDTYAYVSDLCAEYEVSVAGFDREEYTFNAKRGTKLADYVSTIESELDVEGTAYFTGLEEADLNAIITEDLSLTATFNALAFAEVDGGYSVSMGTLTQSDTVNIVIPDTYNGKDVVAVAKEGFKNCQLIETVKFSANLTTVNNFAFYYCYKLKSAVLPDSVTYIGAGAFKLCKSLEYVKIAGVGDKDTLGNQAFQGCESLTKIVAHKSRTLGSDSFKAHDDAGSPLTDYTAKLDVYADTTTTSGIYLQLGDAANVLFTKHVFIYSETVMCGGWRYVDGIPTAYDVESYYTYNGFQSFGVPAHNYFLGVCSVCGAEAHTTGLRLADSGAGWYNIAEYTGTSTEVYIPSFYGGKKVYYANAGTEFNGKGLTLIRFGEGFHWSMMRNLMSTNKTTLETVIFAGSIIGQSGTVNMFNNTYSSLTTLIIPNVTEIPINGITDSAANTPNLKKIVVNANVDIKAYSICGGKADLYSLGGVEDTNITFVESGNGGLTKNIFYFSETAPTDTEHTYWHWVGNEPTVWVVE